MISDGKKRDFGAEGIQAMVEGCTNLRSLNVTGCFRIAKVALQAIGAKLKKLEKIVLARCVNMTEEGASKCRLLLELTLDPKPESNPHSDPQPETGGRQ